MRHIPLPLLNGLITRSESEPSFLRVDLCCEVGLGLAIRGGELGRGFRVCSRNTVSLAEFGSAGVQVEGLQYVRRLVIRGWFLKWNCFFMDRVRQLADFKTRWCVEVGGVGTKLRPKESTSVSMGDS